MALTNGPKLGLLVNGNIGEEHYNALMAQWRAFDSLIQASVIDSALTVPPVSPADGDTYIVAAAATGGWATHDGKLARWNALTPGAWEFYTPKGGWRVWIESASGYFKFDGTDWLSDEPTFEFHYDVGTFIAGKPANDEILLNYITPRAFTLPASLTGSRGKAAVAATASTTFDIQKNGVSIGSMVFAISGTIPSFTFASGVSFASGDVLSVVAPSAADSTLADISFTFAGTRV